MDNKKRIKATLGQAITEYALAGGLIAVASIASISVLSDTFSDVGTDVGDIMFGNGTNIAITSNTSGGTTTTTTTTPTYSTGIPTPTTDQSQVCFSSGLCINVRDEMTVAETSSTLGDSYTHEWSNVLLNELILNLKQMVRLLHLPFKE